MGQCALRGRGAAKAVAAAPPKPAPQWAQRKSSPDMSEDAARALASDEVSCSSSGATPSVSRWRALSFGAASAGSHPPSAAKSVSSMSSVTFSQGSPSVLEIGAGEAAEEFQDTPSTRVGGTNSRGQTDDRHAVFIADLDEFATKLQDQLQGMGEGADVNEAVHQVLRAAEGDEEADAEADDDEPEPASNRRPPVPAGPNSRPSSREVPRQRKALVPLPADVDNRRPVSRQRQASGAATPGEAARGPAAPSAQGTSKRPKSREQRRRAEARRKRDNQDAPWGPGSADARPSSRPSTVPSEPSEMEADQPRMRPRLRSRPSPADAVQKRASNMALELAARVITPQSLQSRRTRAIR